MKLRTVGAGSGLLLVSVLAGGAALRFSTPKAAGPASIDIPSTVVKRGDVRFVVYAKGELQGGNTEVLSTPQVGGQALSITYLRDPGELVKPGDIVVEFDTSDQRLKLREAEADLNEAEQHLIQAQAESEAKAEEARKAISDAHSDLWLAELETWRNEILPAVAARENTLAAAAAQQKLVRLERDLADRLKTARAGIAIQEAAREKARVAAETAKRNIESMTLRAKTEGYVSVQQNTEGNWRWGSYLPAFQVGDTVRAGVPVAQIPDLKSWEATVVIQELDRAHLAESQPADLTVVAMPERPFRGRIKAIGGTTGPPWDRHFDCRIAIENAAPDLRPGMSTRVQITTETKRDVLWVPSQAVFEADGRKFVYARTAAGFVPQNVNLLRRSESQAVIEGVPAGGEVALANPDQLKKQPAGRSRGAMQAISR